MFSLCFIPSILKFGRPALYTNDLLIPNVSGCKYLGTIICQKNCDVDIKRQMRKFYANVNKLLRRFSKCSTPVKCFFYSKLIALTYIVLPCGITLYSDCYENIENCLHEQH